MGQVIRDVLPFGGYWSKLTWQPTLGTVDVRVQIKPKKV